jgi:Zn-dependent protease with chaperone function
MSIGGHSQVATLAFNSDLQPIPFVMRILRYVLRLIFALEALGLLSLAFVTLRDSGAIAAASRLHLGTHSILALFCFIVLLAVLAAITSWRLERGDPLGRWSLLAASIFNLLQFPVGTFVAVSGIFYFLRNPTIDAPLHRKHQPIDGGASKWSGAICMIVQVVWGVVVVSSIRLWTVARGMPQIHSEGLFWITLACAVYGCLLFHELGHFVLGDLVRFRLIGFGVGPLSWSYS